MSLFLDKSKLLKETSLERHSGTSFSKLCESFNSPSFSNLESEGGMDDKSLLLKSKYTNSLNSHNAFGNPKTKSLFSPKSNFCTPCNLEMEEGSPFRLLCLTFTSFSLLISEMSPGSSPSLFSLKSSFSALLYLAFLLNKRLQIIPFPFFFGMQKFTKCPLLYGLPSLLFEINLRGV